jgi:hypothetical protein
MKKAYLHIITWVGTIVMYADHYYGSIRFGDERVEVRYKLTVADAKRFNRAESGAIGPRTIRKYNPGDESTRFSDRNKLIKEAIKLFKKDDHGYEILIEGDNSICDPQKILVGPNKIKAEANALCDEFDHYCGWDCRSEDECRVDDICKKWESIVGPVWENG